MKFAKITFNLLAAALIAAAPSAAFAGNGLLDGGCGCAQKSCGCATQKGGHVAQKGYVHQKSDIIQKGGVAQKGCGVAQRGCGSSKGGGCGSCSICLPPVLPALINGIDAILNGIFCCDSCGSLKGCGCATQKGHVAQKGHVVQKGHVAQKGYAVQKGHVSQKGGSCDCGTSHTGAGNPFVDDLQPPPILDIDADARVRVRSEVARPVSQSVERPTQSVIKTASALSREPRVLPAELISPIEKNRTSRTTIQPTPASVIRTSATTTSGLVVPTNPLR